MQRRQESQFTQHNVYSVLTRQIFQSNHGTIVPSLSNESEISCCDRRRKLIRHVGVTVSVARKNLRLNNMNLKSFLECLLPAKSLPKKSWCFAQLIVGSPHSFLRAHIPRKESGSSTTKPIAKVLPLCFIQDIKVCMRQPMSAGSSAIASVTRFLSDFTPIFVQTFRKIQENPTMPPSPLEKNVPRSLFFDSVSTILAVFRGRRDIKIGQLFA